MISHKITTLFAIVATTVFLTSCGNDEPDLIQNNANQSGINSGQTTQSDNIPELISKHVSVKASYVDFCWTFKIESTLHSALPTKKIQFGIGHGDVDGTTNISVENESYYYTSQNDGIKKVMEFRNPFYYYYIFGPHKSIDIAVECEMYYASYLALKNKGQMQWTSDEKSLYSKLLKYLGEYEADANWQYKPSVQILIDEKKFYIVGTYSHK